VGNNPPENSSGEAATFPKALDTTSKEESICSANLVTEVAADATPNGLICAGDIKIGP